MHGHRNLKLENDKFFVIDTTKGIGGRRGNTFNDAAICEGYIAWKVQ
jgi:hypothetical protein